MATCRSMSLAAITSLALLGLACSRPSGPPGRATVVEVVDGDTFVADVGGSQETVRLLGVDTPETKDPSLPVMCFGPEASAHLAEVLAEGSTVELSLDVEARDRYGRLLAYVRTADGELVNTELLAGGWADLLVIEPNVSLRSELTAARDDARSQGLGLWSACGGIDVPL